MVDNPIHHDVVPSESLTPEGQLFTVMKKILLSPDAVTLDYPQSSNVIAEKIIVIEAPEERLFLLRAIYGQDPHNTSFDVYFIQPRSVGQISIYSDPARNKRMEAYQVHEQYKRRLSEWMETGGFTASREILDLQAGKPPLPPRDIDDDRLKVIVGEINAGKINPFSKSLTNTCVEYIKEQNPGVAVVRQTNMPELAQLPFKPRPRIQTS